MKGAILLLCVAAVALAQRGTRPPPPPSPEDNDASTCGREDRSCPEGQFCLERRDRDSPVYSCVMRRTEDGTCPMRNIFGGGDNEEPRRAVDSDQQRMSPDRMAREIAQGGRDRDNTRRVTGADTRERCALNQFCNDQQMCMTPPADTPCTMARQANNATRCDRQNNFEPRQCRRMAGEQMAAVPTAINCFCVHRMTGRMIDGSMRRVMRPDQAPDCTTRSYRTCRLMRDGRMVDVRHGQSVPRRQNDMCQRCECNDGTLMCNRDADNDNCMRSDPDNDNRRSCMMNGEMVEHNERRQDGKCNRCGCRNGQLQCTRLPACREERDPDSDETERERGDRECEECRDMPARPVCAVRDGRTFPTRCHAMRCQGHEMQDIEDGPCANRDNCAMDRCPMQGSSCFDRGSQTRMSQERSGADNRRLCVNREELRCLPTERMGDTRRILDEDDGNTNLLMRFLMMRNDSDRRPGDRDSSGSDRDDRTVCASDGNSYPSTCHMMVESRGDVIPRPRHHGSCREGEESETMPMRVTNRTVCGTDGVTYSDVDTMRTRGGNVRPDYMGRCMTGGDGDDDTPRRRCMRVMENRMCRNLTNCPMMMRVKPADGCCPICGAALTMAMDQEALDEHVRITGELSNADEFMGGMFRDRGMDDRGMDRPSLINRTIAERCHMAMTRPTHIPGNNTEIVFIARDMAMDAMFCHEMAMDTVRRLNGEVEVNSPESDLVAAATVAPQDEVTEDGAPAFAASCVVLLCAFLSTLLF